MNSYLELNSKAQNAAKKVSERSPVTKDYPTLIKDDLGLSENGISLEQQDLVWKKVHDYLTAYKSTCIGFQANQSFNCTGRLKDYLNLHINNVGDPFTESNYKVNTKVMECAILDYFAKLWNIKVPDSLQEKDRDEAYWGYVMSMGCTEGNLYALYNARDYLSGEPLLCSGDTRIDPDFAGCRPLFCTQTADNSNAFTPVTFYSEDAYYGHAKMMQVLKISTFHKLGSGHFPSPLTYPDDYPNDYCEDYLDQNGWPRLVPVGSDGSMHLPALVKLVSAFVARGYPPIVIFTSGTTFKGGYENPQAAINELVPILKKYNLYERCIHYSSEDPSKFDIRHGFWFHVDGAMGAAHLPFLEMAINEGLIDNQFPNGFPTFDFRIPEMMSIVMSSHKWLGSPFASGIFMTKRKNQLKPPTNPLFIGGGDTTLAGSRNAHGVMALWDLLSRKSHRDFIEQAVRGERMTTLTLKKFQELEEELGEDLWVLRIPGSLFICFKQPRNDIVCRYSLSCKPILVKTKQGILERRIYSHICLMSHVDEVMIGNIIKELKEPGAFPDQDTDSA